MARNGKGFRGRSTVVSLAQQDLALRRLFPGFRTSLRPGVATWEGDLQPRESSPVYRVRIEYKLSGIPRVWVLSPELMPGTPHVWPKDGTLCLYFWRESPWRKCYLIGNTIIPWTALWLLYYELWLETDEWLGPTSHGPPRLPVKGAA